MVVVCLQTELRRYLDDLISRHSCFTFLLPWRGSPEEGRRSGFDSHDFNGRRSLHRVRLPDGI